MKRLVILSLLILTILINMFSFIYINKNLVDMLLFDKTVVAFHSINSNESILDEGFLNKIMDFSKEKNVEISQYSFLSKDKIDIYSTMKDEYKKILLIPNFIFNKDIKVHNLKDIYNVGFKNLFYIDTKDYNIINEFSKDFSEYGVFFELGEVNPRNKFLLNLFLGFMDTDFLFIFALFIFVFISIILFHYLNNKKTYLIYKLWGYSNTQIYCILNKILYKTLFLGVFFCNLITVGFIYILNLTNIFLGFIPMIITLNLVMILLLFLFSIILFSLSFAKLDSKNEKNRLSKIRFITNLSKFCLVLLIMILFKNFSNERIVLKKNQDTLNLWEDTENIFNICTSYSPIYDDLTLEWEHNNKVLEVYKELSKLNKVFIINSINFERSEGISTDSEEMNYDYNYKMNVKSNEDLYSPYGRRLMVDKNYLKRNLIKASSDGKNVFNKIDSNDDVLNILVPKKFKSYKNIIIKSYKEWFYFQKVSVSNMYRQANNQKISEKKIDDLKINLIYVENNQSYFTYNSFSGDNFNRVKDPIVIVYTENVDNSVLASTLGSAMFLESKDEYSALGEIKDITHKYNVYELNTISSVYDKKGQYINYIEDRMDKLILNITIISLILIVLMIIITYIYYKSCISKIIIKSLYGYNFINIYKYLLLSNLTIYVLAVLLITIIYKKIYTYMIIIIVLMLLIDYIVARTVNMILLTKNEIKFIKGELN